MVRVWVPAADLASTVTVLAELAAALVVEGEKPPPQPVANIAIISRQPSNRPVQRFRPDFRSTPAPRRANQGVGTQSANIGSELEVPASAVLGKEIVSMECTGSCPGVTTRGVNEQEAPAGAAVQDRNTGLNRRRSAVTVSW